MFQITLLSQCRYCTNMNHNHWKIMLQELFLTLLSLIHLPPPVLCFSRGSPTSACAGSMLPRHGYDPQTGASPVEIVVDQQAISHKEYLRVTIRSSQAFKGFLVKAVDILQFDNKCKELFVVCHSCFVLLLKLQESYLCF